jgi:hypothetical protein
MDREQIFQHLEQQDIAVFLELLECAYDEMNTNRRRAVFGQFAQRIPPAVRDGKSLLQEVGAFQQDSLAGKYYAPFRINSKNFMDIPEETEEWFERLGDLLQGSLHLSEQGEHEWAVACFRILYDLIETMESGEEIVFADELGSWMIPGDTQQFIAAYLTSLAAISTPEAFTEQAVPLVKRDRFNSFADQVYSTALKVANAEQTRSLKAEIKRQQIQTS